MSIEDSFSIPGRGTVISESIERRTIKKGRFARTCRILNLNSRNTGLEMFHKSPDCREAGNKLGALVRGLKREDAKRGMVLCAPGTVSPYTKCRAQVYILKKEEGGWHKPFLTNYTPQMHLRTGDVATTITLDEGK